MGSTSPPSAREWAGAGAGVSSARLRRFSIYAIVLAAAAAAMLAHLSVMPSLGIIAPLLPFVPAILIGAWLGGLWPGLFATLLGTLAGAYLFLRPGVALANLEPHEWLRLFLFVTSGTVISALIEQMHRARRRADLLALERGRLEHATRTSEARLAAILNQLPVGVGLLDARGEFLLTNPLMDRLSMKRIPSVEPTAVARWTAFDEHGEPLPSTMWPAARALRGEPVPGIECEYVHDDGEKRWYSVAAAPLRDDNGVVDHAVVVIQDIDRLKRASQALVEADRRKDEFLATLAHELRNPLAPIKNAVEMLRLRGPDHALLNDARSVIDRQLQHMVRLVDDLLDVSRITQNKLELRRATVDARAVIRQALETVRPHADRSRQRILTELPDEPAHVHADPVRLAQVLTNLLSNASKYSGPDTTIAVRLHIAQGEAVVAVTDQGIGIEPLEMDRLFEMFSQSSSALDRTQAGLGIGLWLSKRLIEMQGGSIAAASAGRHAGSTFTLRMPLHVSPAGEPRAPAPASVQAAQPARVLVVDDNVDGATTLTELLRLYGHDVQVAHDGEEAIAAAERFAPDVMLLDIGLPKMNGYEVCRRIRQRAGGDRLSIVAMTGWGQSDDRRRSAEAGFDAHLVKPIDFPELIHAVEQATARRS